MPDARPVGTVGFVGLGQIGAPMATRLAVWSDGLRVFDLRAEAMAPLLDAGASAADSVADLGAACDLVSVMVLDDAQVRGVLDELLTTARPGTIVAVHSTVRPETAEELARTAAERDVHVLDVPVSGGFMGAHEGTLAALVGGDRDAYERAKPVLAHWATLVVHLGPAGAATRAKLARNMMHFVSYTAAFEAQRLAEAAGIDLRKLASIVRHSDAVTGGASAIMVRDRTGDLDPSDGLYDIFVHTRGLAEKDLSLALEMADELGVDAPLAKLALDRFAEGLGVPHLPHA
jgi:3-hydroxyisobutyrate dehydrogenase-like beta-hydroxyacid dehydrogenase